MNAPEWLARRNGTVKLGSDKNTWYVVLNNDPQYGVVAVPVDGKYGAYVRQTVNAQRIPSAGVYATPDEAVRGGLEDLRKSLGWE